MRDTLVIAVILSALIIGYKQFHKSGFVAQPALSQFKSNPSNSVQAKSGRGSLRERRFTNRKGVHNERTNRKSNLSLENQRSSERGSGDVAEAEKLTSIYPESESSSAGIAASVATPKEEKRSSAAPIVPVKDFVQYRKKKLATLPDVSGPAPEGLRVYLWCLEVKKRGLEYSGKSQCDRLLDNSSLAKAATSYGSQPVPTGLNH